MVKKNKLSLALEIKPKKKYEKYVDSLIILHGNGFPLYSNIKDEKLNSILYSMTHSGFLSAIVNYYRLLKYENNIISFKLPQISYIKAYDTDIFFYCNQNNIVYVLITKTNSFRINRKLKLVKQLMKSLDEFFSSELVINDWSSLTKENILLISQKIDLICNNFFNKVILSFYF